jgi:uncharacterized protein HemX
LTFFGAGIYNLEKRTDIRFKEGGERKMKKAVTVILSLSLIGMFFTVFAGCGADMKAENGKLKAENTNLKSENDKLKLDAQKLKEDVQKAAAEKDGTIGNLKAEIETLKKQVEDLMAKMPKPKKKK